MKFLSLKNVTVKVQGRVVLRDISININAGEQLAIIGESGSGKTVLAQTIAGQHYYSGEMFFNPEFIAKYRTSVVLVDQQHRFKNLSGMGNQFYYQQRYNSFDASDATTVLNDLESAGYVAFKHHTLIGLLDIEKVFDEPLIQLSNGENKRLQLAKALLKHPGLLILDNPFVGLDADGRQVLHSIINFLISNGQQVILITTPHDIPSAITHVTILKNGKALNMPSENFLKTSSQNNVPVFDTNLLTRLEAPLFTFSTAIKMVNASVTYNNNEILKNINWIVNKGDKWNVSGNNGAGKSTLLSLVTADNPQAYANEIYLFDKRRGSGESIWDIKKCIGFVSPEMHLYFEQSANVFETIASGLFDTIALFRKINTSEEQAVEH